MKTFRVFVLPICSMAIACAALWGQNASKKDNLQAPKVTDFISSLTHDDAAIRALAARKLADFAFWEDEVTIPALAQALKDPDPVVRAFCVQALGRRHGVAQDHRPAIISLLKDRDPKVRKEAAIALGNMSYDAKAKPKTVFDPSAVAPLIEALGDSDAEVRANAAAALGRRDAVAASAVESLIGLLKDKDADVRLQAAIAFMNLGDCAGEAKASLIKAVHDKDQKVRDHMLWALNAVCASVDEEVVRIDIDFLKDPCARVRATAACVLRRPFQEGKFTKIIIPALLKALEDKERLVRTCAIYTFEKGGTWSESALEPLSNLRQNDLDRSVREAAEEVIKKIKSDLKRS
jgi:HEAT repeat protein